VNHTNKILAAAGCLALWVSGAQAATRDDIAKRLEPVGQVCIQGKACPGMEVTASASGGAARTPDDIIARHCIACHGPGLLNAPKIGDTAAWKDRADHQGGLDGILAKAISGINAMPPKGTCGDCSDEDLKSAIKKMSGL
jgi:cytochrome c5